MRTILFQKDISKALLVKALRPLWPGVVYSPLAPVSDVEIADAPLPGGRWVRVRNRLSGVCGSDLHLLHVEADPRVGLAALPATDRRYLGHEVVGDVVEVGPDVESLRVGDRVVLDYEGDHCLNQGIDPPCRHCRDGNRYLCENASLGIGPRRLGGGWGDGLVAHEVDLYPVPDGLDDAAAVLVEPLSVGVRAALRRLPGPGERALVIGSGTLGLAVIQALRALSPECEVVAMARYPQQVEMARALGARRVLSGGDAYAEVARLTGGKLYAGSLGSRMLLGGVDVVYDCVGSARTVTDGLRWARAGGTVVLAGVRLAPMGIDLTPVWHQEVDLVGLYGHGTETHDGTRVHTYDLTCGLLLEGRLTAEGLITHRFPLAQWRQAARAAADKRSGALKVVIDCVAEG